MRTAIRLVSVLLFVLVGSIANAQGTGESAADEAARIFLQRFDSGHPAAAIYQTLLGRRAKSMVDEDSFLSGIASLRAQVGGTASGREIFFSTPMDSLPGIDGRGTFYLFRYASTYPIGRVVQEIAVEREDDSWKIVSFEFRNAPAGGR